MSRHRLSGKSWRRLAPGTYASVALDDTPLLALAAAGRRLPPSAVFSGMTAALLHGLDVTPAGRIEVTIPPGPRSSVRGWARVRRAALTADEVVIRHGLRVTSVHRTLADIAQQRPLVEAVALADMALNARLTTAGRLRAYAEARFGHKGVVALRRVAQLCDSGAESPMETHLRVLLVSTGLPRPETQIELSDAAGRFIARVDLYYADRRLAIEYDGQGHRATLVEDDRRQNRMLAGGYRLLRFTAADLLGDPTSVVQHVRTALKSTKAPPTSSHGAPLSTNAGA